MRTSRENVLKVGWSHIGLDSPPGREGSRALEPKMEMIKVVSVWGVGLAKLMMNPEPFCGPGEQDSRMPRESSREPRGASGWLSFGSLSGDFSRSPS